MAYPPYDEVHIFSTQQLVDFKEYFGGYAADYIRLEADVVCEIWLFLKGGSNFKYNRGMRRNTPIDLTEYTVDQMIVKPQTAGTTTTLYVHATSDMED